jgi:hypothetical protein
MAQPTTGKAPGAGTRRRSILLSIVGPVVLILAATGWVWTSAEQRDNVAVSLSAPPKCTTTALAWRRVGVGHRIPTMRLQEPMDCQALLRVTNHGRWPVRIIDVVMPLMGPHAGGAFDVEEVDGLRPVPGITRGLASAVFPLDRRLAPGDRYAVPIHFTFRPGGCTARRALIWVEQMPQITVSALGRTGTVSGHQVIAFQGTVASDNCASPPPRSIGPSKQTSP